MDQKFTNNTSIKNFLRFAPIIVFQLSKITIGIIKFTKKINHIEIPSIPPINKPKTSNLN